MLSAPGNASKDTGKTPDPEEGFGGFSGIGLDGQWAVEMGEGHAADVVEGGTAPGQLPEVTEDGKDWGEWAREWREDPKGRADRFVKAWNADAVARGKQPVRQADLQNRPRSKRKGKGDKQKLGVASSRGFGGSNVRPTKGVPDRLVVADVSADEAGDSDIEQDEDSVVDWSEGQQLVEHQRRDYTAEIQQETERLAKMNHRDRQRLAKKLRKALGKGEKKTPSKSDDRLPEITAANMGLDGKTFYPSKEVGDQKESSNGAASAASLSRDRTTDATASASDLGTRAEFAPGTDGGMVPSGEDLQVAAERLSDDKSWDAEARDGNASTVSLCDTQRDNLGQRDSEDDEDELDRIRKSFGITAGGRLPGDQSEVAVTAASTKASGTSAVFEDSSARSETVLLDGQEIQEGQVEDSRSTRVARGLLRLEGDEDEDVIGKSNEKNREEIEEDELRRLGMFDGGSSIVPEAVSDADGKRERDNEQDESERIRRAFGLGPTRLSGNAQE